MGSSNTFIAKLSSLRFNFEFLCFKQKKRSFGRSGAVNFSQIIHFRPFLIRLGPLLMARLSMLDEFHIGAKFSAAYRAWISLSSRSFPLDSFLHCFAEIILSLKNLRQVSSFFLIAYLSPLPEGWTFRLSSTTVSGRVILDSASEPFFERLGEFVSVPDTSPFFLWLAMCCVRCELKWELF